MRLGRRAADPVERVYAVGDIHGRFDLFRRLMAIIERDHRARGPVATRIVLLGDIIDRGPESARMVEGCMALTRSTRRFVVLKGNHEAMMVEALRGDYTVFERWLEFGGRKTLLSWGMDAALLEQGATIETMRGARAAVGEDVLKWLSALPLQCQHDGYLFVHAGIRPGVRLSKQRPEDLLWITDEFLESAEHHGAMVVHGHSISERGPVFRSNRIGIDTGAFRTDRLTAVGIERGEVWSLETTPEVAKPRTADPVTEALNEYYQDLVAKVQARQGSQTGGG